jgi:FKBP-type peptidyl-prolyl cis-trans isomerase FklB
MRIRTCHFCVLTALVLCSAAYAADKAPSDKTSILKTEKDRTSYAVGMYYGRRLLDADLDLNILFRGIQDTHGNKTTLLSDKEFDALLKAFGNMMNAKVKKQQQEQIQKSEAAGKAFLEANAKKEGIKVLKSGLQYKVIQAGTGKIPTKTDRVKVQYRGTLIDGTEFDSSYKSGKPAEFGVTGVIRGWTEALQLMKEGAKWQLYIPASLAYGQRKKPTIPAGSALIFDVELVEILEKKAKTPPTRSR